MSDYPEHLNPFDDNYTGNTVEPPCPAPRQKYNTWSAPRTHRISTLDRVKIPKTPTFLKKPWAALNVSSGSKLVRRLSFLKTTVEKLTSRNPKKLSHSISLTESDLPPRSNSVHDDFAFRIVSPKVKEKLRQQAFSSPRPVESADNSDVSPSPQVNGCTPSPSPSTTIDSNSLPASPESEKELNLGARPKIRKKRPPPPPPVDSSKPAYILPVLQIVEPGDTPCDNGITTQELENDQYSVDDAKPKATDNSLNKTDSN